MNIQQYFGTLVILLVILYVIWYLINTMRKDYKDDWGEIETEEEPRNKFGNVYYSSKHPDNPNWTDLEKRE